MAPRSILDLLKQTAKEVGDDDVMGLSAAIAYYTVFSLPPLLVIILAVAGAVFGAEAVRDALFGQIAFAGPQASASVREMIENASSIGESTGAKIGGLAALLFGATTAFAQLQASLNRAWGVTPAPNKSGVKGFVLKRVLSFGMILTIAFFLLVSLAISGVIAAMGDMAQGVGPAALNEGFWTVVSAVVSFVVTTALFAVMFKVLPDADVDWKDVGVGAAFTALLFTIGKTLIALYVGKADPGSAFGAAGSLALVLVWVYYSALIVLVGAEFTQVWATRYGKQIRPEAHAVTAEEAERLKAEEEAKEGGVHPLALPRDPQPY